MFSSTNKIHYIKPIVTNKTSFSVLKKKINFKMKLIFLAFAVFISISSAEIFPRKCPTTFQTVNDFKIEDYLGKWYEIERYLNIFQSNESTCTFATYDLKKNGDIKVINSNIKGGKTSSVEGTAKLSFPDEVPVQGKISVSFFNKPFVPNYFVMETDYTNYSIVWNCKDVGENESHEMAWVLSRSTELTEEIQLKVNKAVEKFFDKNLLVKTVQTRYFSSRKFIY